MKHKPIGKITPAVDVKYSGYILFHGSCINGRYYQAVDGVTEKGQLIFSALPQQWLDFIETSTAKKKTPSNSHSEYKPVVIDGDFGKMYENCPFVRRCVDYSYCLSEPEWHQFARLMNNFERGEELFIEFSKNHSDFNLEEARNKFLYAWKYPVSCRTISEVSSTCKYCNNFTTEGENKMTRKVEERIQAVKTPLEFAKKDFAAWLESIKSGVPKYSHFGTNWSIKLPKDVAEPDIKKEIFFYENCTYCYSQIYVGKDKTPTVVIKKLVNGIPFKVDLQLLISNNRTEEKPVATICIVFKLNNGKLSKPILLDSRAKTKYNDFVHATNKSNNRLQFNLDDVATGAKQMLAYGSSADKVIDELSMLGNVASGLQIPIGQLIYLYGTLRTQGRAMTVDIRQFAGRGIPIYEELAKVLGVTKDQVGELVKEGKVGFAEVEQAFKNMTSEGGKFANLMENSAGTWPQRLSNIEDTLFQKMNEFGNKYKEVFEFGIGTAEDLVESLDDVLSVIGGLIAAYGTYKAALIATAVAQKAVGFVESIRLIAMYRKEMGLATAAQQAFNLASKSNVYVTLLAALVGIGTAVYMFSKNADDATTSQGKLNLALAESEKASLSEQRELAKLKGELSALKKGTDEYNEVKDKIVKGFSKHYAGLDEEIERVGLTEQAYNRLTDAITKSYGARQYEKFKSAQTEELDSLMSENLSKIQERLIDKLGEEEGSKYYTKIRNAILEGSVKAINGTFNLSGLDKETNAALDKVAGKGGLLVNRSVEQYIANILKKIVDKAAEIYHIGRNQ